MSFYTSLHLLNLGRPLLDHAVEVDCIKLSAKYACPHGEYSAEKSEYFESRCSKSEQQSKVKKNIKYVDKLLKSYKCIFLSWDLNEPLILLFENGSIVYMEFNEENNTLLKIDIDNNLCGKLLPSRIVDVVKAKNCIYITYTEPKLALIYFNQDSPSLFSRIFGRKKGKLGFEPKIVNYDIYFHNIKSLDKKLSVNIQSDLLLIWWKNSNDIWPWTPITHLNDDKLNMLIYTVKIPCIALLCSITVQDELLHANFSKIHSKQFFTLEEIKKVDEVIVNVCVHQIIHKEHHLIHTEKLDVRGSLIAFHWSSTDDKLLAADSSGILLLYDANEKSTIVTELKFIPKHLSWHPQNCIALIVSKNNRILCFDAALNNINFKLCHKPFTELKHIELGSYFSEPFSVQKVLWQKSAFNDTCLFLLDSEFSLAVIKFSFGCITRHNITAFEIISEYLKFNKLDKAILVLRSLDWSYSSELKFQCLSKIVNSLLRKPLNVQTLSSLEFALGSFYDYIEAMPERIVEMFEQRMHHLARRFFHHLLRYNKFRKAFPLAIDLESQDIFLDLHHVAKQKGLTILAAVALRKAREFDESSESCSSESCSSNSNSESSCCDFTNTGSYQNNPASSHSTESSYWDITSIDSYQNNPGGDVIQPQIYNKVDIPHLSVKSKKLPNIEANEECSSYAVSYKPYNMDFTVNNSKYLNYRSMCHESDLNASVFHNLPQISNANAYQRVAYIPDNPCFLLSSKSEISECPNFFRQLGSTYIEEKMEGEFGENSGIRRNIGESTIVEQNKGKITQESVVRKEYKREKRRQARNRENITADEENKEENRQIIDIQGRSIIEEENKSEQRRDARNRENLTFEDESREGKNAQFINIQGRSLVGKEDKREKRRKQTRNRENITADEETEGKNAQILNIQGISIVGEESNREKRNTETLTFEEESKEEKNTQIINIQRRSTVGDKNKTEKRRQARNRENMTAEEENEEVEGIQIKLAHLGVI